MKDRSDDPPHHERMLLPRSYISLLSLVGKCDRTLGFLLLITTMMMMMMMILLLLMMMMMVVVVIKYVLKPEKTKACCYKPSDSFEMEVIEFSFLTGS